jgi:metal-responsive CopG/Arc/MetJ family transcriptional regulator
VNSVLQVRPQKQKSRAGTKTGVTTYLEGDDLGLLDELVSWANSDRSDIIRQALRNLHKEVKRERRKAAKNEPAAVEA